MPKQFQELEERLLRAGVAPRHVRRYLGELSEHLSDLRTEEEKAGRSRPDAESTALSRLGTTNELAKAMIEQRQFQSWSARAPWAVFGLGPILVLGLAWTVSLFVLWSGWQMFLPGAKTPFVPQSGLLANIYFQLDRAVYYGAPFLLGWGMSVVAARQRIGALWPIAGSTMIALALVTAQVRANRVDADGIGHISLRFALAANAQTIYTGLIHTGEIR